MFKEKVTRWFLGGQSYDFFSRNNDRIRSHNLKYTGIVLIGMCLVTFAYYIFDLNSLGSSEMRTSYLIFFLVSAGLYLLDFFVVRKNITKTTPYFFFVAELVFTFLIFVGPVYDSSTTAVYIPVFFLAMPLLPIIPMQWTCLMMLVDMAAFASVAFMFKTPEMASFDLVNSVTCMFFGLVLGRSILAGRLNEIDAYNKLKERSESELSVALNAANTDPLTGVRSRAAYEHAEAVVDAQITRGSNPTFGIVVCDINWLKETNDTYGHDLGDHLIKACCKVICNVFIHSPVFRIGGDEFAVLLQGEDYENRRLLMEQLAKELNYDQSGISLARGLSVFNPAEDTSVDNVFVRADSAMYENKNRIKASRHFDDSIYMAVK